MPEITFTRFVSAVSGRLVSRWDSAGSYFGARVATAEERKAGSDHITWDPDCVVPLTDEFCRRYDRELRNAVRNGDLKERDEAAWREWLLLEERRESDRLKALEPEPAADAATAVDADPEPSPADSAEPPKKSKKEAR